MKRSDKFLIGALLTLGIFFVILTACKSTISTNNNTVNSIIVKQQHIIDSLDRNNNLLIDYYCATENLLDSIFTHFVWQDVMDPYDYYEATDNIYYEEYLYKYLENKRRCIW